MRSARRVPTSLSSVFPQFFRPPGKRSVRCQRDRALNQLVLEGHEIGAGSPVFIIAEIAQAHDGSLGTAHAYIDAVAAAGASAVKFQTHIADAESTPGEPFRVHFSPAGRHALRLLAANGVHAAAMARSGRSCPAARFGLFIDSLFPGGRRLARAIGRCRRGKSARAK